MPHIIKVLYITVNAWISLLNGLLLYYALSILPSFSYENQTFSISDSQTKAMHEYILRKYFELIHRERIYLETGEPRVYSLIFRLLTELTEKYMLSTVFIFM